MICACVVLRCFTEKPETFVCEYLFFLPKMTIAHHRLDHARAGCSTTTHLSFFRLGSSRPRENCACCEFRCSYTIGRICYFTARKGMKSTPMPVWYDVGFDIVHLCGILFVLVCLSLRRKTRTFLCESCSNNDFVVCFKCAG